MTASAGVLKSNDSVASFFSARQPLGLGRQFGFGMDAFNRQVIRPHRFIANSAAIYAHGIDIGACNFHLAREQYLTCTARIHLIDEQRLLAIGVVKN